MKKIVLNTFLKEEGVKGDCNIETDWNGGTPKSRVGSDLLGRDRQLTSYAAALFCGGVGIHDQFPLKP